MAHGRRPKVKSRRVTTRNESCGAGGNESAEKPRLQTAVDTAVVRKPNFYLGPNKPKEAAIKDPSKIRDPKVGGLSLETQKLKSLTDTFYQLSCMLD
jgi:hypothetical protein